MAMHSLRNADGHDWAESEDILDGCDCDVCALEERGVGTAYVLQIEKLADGEGYVAQVKAMPGTRVVEATEDGAVDACLRVFAALHDARKLHATTALWHARGDES